MTKQSKTVEYKVVVGQSITPNSNGAEVLRFNIDVLARKNFTERFSTLIGVVAFTQNDIGDTDRQFERDYIRGKIRMDYKFKRHWSVYGLYAYTFNDQDDNFTDGWTVRNHFLSAGITYRGDGWRW
jgi:predicted porin